MSLLGLVVAIQMLFPVFGNTNGNYSTLALTNTSSADAEFTVRLKAPNGQETNFVRLPIESGKQRTFTIESLLPNSGVPLEGWVSVEATTDRFTAYLASGTGESLSGIEPASQPALTSYLPHIRLSKGVAETNDTDTAIAVVNPRGETANVAIRLSSYDKSLATTIFVTVPAQGSQVFRVSTLLPPGTTRFEGRATVHSFSPLAVWEQVEAPQAWSALRARSEADLNLDTLTTAPYFAFGGNFQSSLTLWNPMGPPLTLEAVAYDNQGLPLGEPVRMTLETGQAISSRVESLFRIPVIATVPPTVVTGSIRLREINNKPFRVFGVLEIAGTDAIHSASLLYWLSSSAGRTWDVPLVAPNERYYTGYSILATNESGTLTNTAIEVLDLNGVVVQRIARSLPPGSLAVGVITPVAPGAYMRIWASQPVSVLGTVGTNDGSLFDAVVPMR